MRGLIGLLSVLAVSILFLTPVAASCAPPAPVADNAARAVAVVHGTVTGVGSGSLTLQVDRVLKGSVGTTVVVFLGPGRGGAGGTAVATSVDYAAAVGTEHVLYLIRGDDGQLETNACIGSHAGPPTADEVAFFGAGTPAGPATGTVVPETASGSAASGRIDPIWPALIVLFGAALAALVVGLRVVDLRKGS
jgi:hypothetical protein